MPYNSPIKLEHVQAVLRAMIRMPGSTKPQLCEATGLPASTMHGIMELLSRSGVLTAPETAPSGGGRPAARYRINGELGVMVGVSLRIDRVDVGLFDLCCKPLCSTTRPLDLPAVGPESCTAEIAETVTQLLKDAGVDRSACCGVGITVPGPVDVPDGVISRISAAPLWQGFPLAGRLSEALHLPVAADKDVYAAVSYLKHLGRSDRDKCTVYLSICEGIGSALYADGRVFRGRHSLAGEIGHLTVRRDGIPCRCGNTGCLELYCSDIGIVQQYNAQAAHRCTHIGEVVERLQKGDAVAVKVIAQAIRYLVDMTSNIIMSYDPDELLIYCSWLSQQRSLYFHMLDALYAKSTFTRQHTVDIKLLEEAPLNLNAAGALACDELLLRADSPFMERLK